MNLHGLPLAVTVALLFPSLARPARAQANPQWIQARVATARAGHAMAYDIVRQRIVLFGGRTGSIVGTSQTREWDGSIWSEREPVTRPSDRANHAMAYDVARRRVVLFGGMGGNALGLDDTWEWDGDEWLSRPTAVAPPPRWAHALAYDAVRQRVVLFGGEDASYRAVGDTWEWDGTRWTQLQPSRSPPARFAHAMAFDAVRQRVVLFGGEATRSSYADASVWEWDGADWTEHAVPSPGERSDHAMAYDPFRRQVLLFGGVRWPSASRFADLWQWDGVAWTRREPPAAPPARHEHAMAFDIARQCAVMFGGSDAGGNEFGDTWCFDGARWVAPAGAEVPRGRDGHVLVHHAASGSTVLIGGSLTTGSWASLGDTWAWYTHGWVRQLPAVEPPARAGHAACYDAERQRIVVFGGRRPGETGWSGRNDTWEWDGAAWHDVTSPGPAARYQHALAYDAARRRTVLFGGLAQLFAGGDTWEWDGVSWLQRTPLASPGARMGHAMAYDPIRQRVVLFGGSAVVLPSDHTWEWDGTTWRQVVVATRPAARLGHSMTWDPERRAVVLHGGYHTNSAFPLFDDTWAWDGSVWTQIAAGGPRQRFGSNALTHDPLGRRLMLFGGAPAGGDETWFLVTAPARHQAYGTACSGSGSGSAPLLTCTPPFLGNPQFTLECVAGRATAVCLFHLAFSRQAFSLGDGCSLYFGSPSVPVPVVTDAFGVARVQFPLALEPSFTGAVVFAQAMVTDPGSRIFGFVFSAGRELVLGD